MSNNEWFVGRVVDGRVVYTEVVYIEKELDVATLMNLYDPTMYTKVLKTLMSNKNDFYIAAANGARIHIKNDTVCVIAQGVQINVSKDEFLQLVLNLLVPQIGLTKQREKKLVKRLCDAGSQGCYGPKCHVCKGTGYEEVWE